MASPFVSDDSRWLAVTTRDPSADLHFVYAVRTTKIYCRPICKARLARRHNVLFFDLAQDAVRAGFRPCKRCKPQVASAMPEELAEVKIRALLARPRQLRVAPATSGEMARAMGLSKWHFHRTFKKLTGSTPYEYFAATGAATSSTSGESGTPESGVSGLEAPAMGSGLDVGLDWNFSEPWPVQWPNMDAFDMPPMDPMLESGVIEPTLASGPEWSVSSCDWDELQKMLGGP